MPKISIIMPVYNKRPYLERSLDSVLNQDFSDYELIAVDDGSTDDSLAILDAYRSRDERIRIIHTENHGVSHARNLGLENADGEYVTFLDADDELKPRYLSSLYKTLQQNNVDIVIQGITKVFLDGHKETVSSELKSGAYTMTDLLPAFAAIQKKTGIFGYSAGKLFSAKSAGKTRFDEKLSLAEDFDFYLRLFRKIKTVFMENESNYLYYQELPGSSADIRDEDIDYYGQFKVNCRYRDFMKENDSYFENNETIINDMIINSGYHMLLYAKEDVFSDRCAFFRENVDELTINQANNRFERSVLYSIRKGNETKAHFLIIAYKKGRALKRMIMQ